MLGKKYIMVGILVLASILFCACQSNPGKDTVASKSDGVFQKKIQYSVQNEEMQNLSLTHSGDFQSTDESVVFTWNIDQTISYGAMPVLEVSPRFFTGEDAKHVAEALFGEKTIFYDLGPASKRQLSKSEILKRIQILSQYATNDSLYELMGEEANLAELKYWLEHYTIEYENAPDENPHKKCDWKLKDSQFYEEDASSSAFRSDWLMATGTVNEHNYLLRTYVHNQNDYLENAIYVTLGDGNDATYVAKTADIAKMCQTNEPTDAQIISVKARAEEMLSKMGLGDFVIAEVIVEKQYFGDRPAYQIRVDAVPVFEGRKTLYGDFGRSYVAKEAYNSNYPVGQTQFYFSANGELISFGIHSLVEVKAVKNSNVAVLPMEELIDKAQTHMALYDAQALDKFTGNALMLEALTGYDSDKLDCKVEITKLEFGLARFPIPDSCNFYYAPAVVFSGTIDYYDSDTGEIITGTGNPYGTRIQSLAVVNAVDGTIY